MTKWLVSAALAALLLVIIFTAYACRNQAPEEEAEVATTDYASYPVFDGQGLGLRYTPAASSFMVWSPPAAAMRLLLYEQDLEGEPYQTVNMTQGEGGVWAATVSGDVKGKYYAFQAQFDGVWHDPVPDPYVRAVGANGRRGQVVDLAETNPPGWDNDQRPPLSDPNSVILYELHLRDLSIHPSSGSAYPGKYLALTQTGTRNPAGLATGIDHLKELGITHLHLLPVFDYLSVDETRLDEPQFNWGYDPQNYNVPEGGYSTNPHDGAVRIREFKQMVQALHQNGIRVIMDVVYNHTGATEASLFNQLVPGYYYRQNAAGGFSDAASCGNEIASERPMVRKFMLESVKYWVEEYHIDGFRFDLMGIHDIETMNLISRELHAIDPSIFLYGEGWTAGASPLPDSLRALKANTSQLDRIAAFSDNIRDGVKGHVFTHDDRGFASGKPGMEETVKFGIVASTSHPQVNYDLVQWLDPKQPWAAEPFQTITYVSCHDNHTLWDRLLNSTPQAAEADRIRMHKLASAIVLTSQGVSFLHAGVEMLRTKQGVENSYNAPDSINQIDWNRKSRYREVFAYFQGLVAMRKNHPAFRMSSTAAIQANLRFIEGTPPLLIAYTLNGAAVGDSWSQIVVALNGAGQAQTIDIPAGPWTVMVNDQQVADTGITRINGAKLTVPAYTAMVLAKGQ